MNSLITLSLLAAPFVVIAAVITLLVMVIGDGTARSGH